MQFTAYNASSVYQVYYAEDYEDYTASTTTDNISTASKSDGGTKVIGVGGLVVPSITDATKYGSPMSGMKLIH